MELNEKLSKNIFDLLENSQIIATIGMCKNAGKTTVLNYLVQGYESYFPIGITSIGYDGEEKDAITLLPKPRIQVFPGMYVATGSSCLAITKIQFEYVYDTGINTTVGVIHIIKVLTKGVLEVSGPSMASQIKAVCEKMLELGCKKVIADGAAGRISFAAVADGVVLSVGAAMSSDMEKVVQEASYITKLLKLEPEKNVISLIRPLDCVYSIQQVDTETYYVFRGALGNQDIEGFVKGKNIVVRNATSIFVSPNVYHRFVYNGGRILVQEGIHLKAITINPMTPYGEWFDSELFMKKMQEKVELPIFNIKNEEISKNNNEKGE